MDGRTPRKFRLLDFISLVTSLCLLFTVIVIQWKIIPTYTAILAEGGFSMPVPVSVGEKLLVWMPGYGLLFLLGWALYRRLRVRPEPALGLSPVVAVLNILSVAVLVAQTTGFVALAVHIVAIRR